MRDYFKETTGAATPAEVGRSTLDSDEKRTIEITREEAEHFAFVLNLQRVLLRDEIQHIANKRSLTNAQKAETVAGCRKRLEMVTDLNTRICRTFHINGY